MTKTHLTTEELYDILKKSPTTIQLDSFINQEECQEKINQFIESEFLVREVNLNDISLIATSKNTLYDEQMKWIQENKNFLFPTITNYQPYG